MNKQLSRPVFVSFLGLTNYTEVVYPDPIGREVLKVAPPTPYVQQAFLHYLVEAGERPEVYMFLTQGAKDMHYDKVGGLFERLTALGLTLHAIAIDDPGDEASVWRTFQSMVDVFKEGDRVWFDVTHAFRILPMLGLVALNYVRALKNIHIEGIWYGDYNPRAEPPRPAASRDVTSFVAIQDWAYATQTLQQRGSLRELSSLSSGAVRQSLAESKKAFGKRKESFNRLRKSLSALADYFELANAHALVDSTTWRAVEQGFLELREQYAESYDPAARPVLDLLARIETKLAGGLEGTHREVEVVKWASDHGLIQQGFTMLDELVTTALCRIIKVDEENKEARKLVSAFLKLQPSDEFDGDRYDKLIDQQTPAQLVKKLESLPKLINWKQLVNLVAEPRNALNHAGYDRLSNHIKYNTYASSLAKGLKQFEVLLSN